MDTEERTMDVNYKGLIDVAAIANVVATIVGWLPAIAAVLSIVWTGIQIYSWAKSRK